MKTAIFSGNSAKMYKYDVKKASLETDRVTQIKLAYEQNGAERSNLRYGYVNQPGGYIPPEVFA